jgi:hypothetical protein
MMTAPTTTMTGAELKVKLNGLGLAPSWLADRMGVTMRTVVRWFDGDRIPSRVPADLEQVAEATLDEMRKMVDTIEPSSDGTVVLRTYRTDDEFGDKQWPASWHRMLVFRVLEHFKAQGNTVIVEYW